MHIAVIGSGKMGAAIFRVLANGPMEEATLYSRSEERAKEQEQKFLRGLARARRRGVITEEDFGSKKDSVHFTNRLKDLASADVLIEAVPDEYELKLNLLRELESIIASKAILTTNTSSVSIERLAGGLNYPERFCGLHFFHPVMMIMLVEIIKWSGASNDAIDTLNGFCKRIQRTPIVVSDTPGSAINAILGYHYMEALYLLDEGHVLPSRVDELAKRYFYLGPCESIDVVGIDFFVKAVRSMLQVPEASWLSGTRTELRPDETGGRKGFRAPTLLSKMLSANRLGKRVSKGIYRYEKDVAIDEALDFYADPDPGDQPHSSLPTDDFIAKRLLYAIFNGSLDTLRRSAASVEAIDLGVKEVLLMKEGPFTMMQAVGEDAVRQNFAHLAENVGTRFTQTVFPFPQASERSR